jgi:truncated hemoglobin YjbI
MIVHPLTEAELASRADLQDRGDIERLVVAFYRYAAMDELLGPVFAAAHVDWPGHIDTLTDFWAWQLLGERRRWPRRCVACVPVKRVQRTSQSNRSGLLRMMAGRLTDERQLGDHPDHERKLAMTVRPSACSSVQYSGWNCVPTICRSL